MRLLTSVKEALLLIVILNDYKRNKASAKEASMISVLCDRIEKCLQMQNQKK